MKSNSEKGKGKPWMYELQYFNQRWENVHVIVWSVSAVFSGEMHIIPIVHTWEDTNWKMARMTLNSETLSHKDGLAYLTHQSSMRIDLIIDYKYIVALLWKANFLKVREQ